MLVFSGCVSPLFPFLTYQQYGRNNLGAQRHLPCLSPGLEVPVHADGMLEQKRMLVHYKRDSLGFRICFLAVAQGLRDLCSSFMCSSNMECGNFRPRNAVCAIL